MSNQTICTYFLQIYRFVLSVEHASFWLALNALFTVISIFLACFVIYSLVKTKQIYRSPLMILFLYACLNDILFASLGLAKYSLQFYGVHVKCYIYALVVYFAQFSHSLALDIMLLVAYGRYLYAKYVFDVTRRITIKRVNISVVCTLLVTFLHAGIPNISFITKNKNSYMLGQFIYALKMAAVTVIIITFYFRGYQAMRERNHHERTQNNISRGERMFFLTMVTVCIMIIIMHLPYTLSTVMETIFVYTNNQSKIPYWCKYYHVVSNTIHRLFPTANQVVFIYNNTEIRLFIVEKLTIFKGKCVGSSGEVEHRQEANDINGELSVKGRWCDRLPLQRTSLKLARHKNLPRCKDTDELENMQCPSMSPSSLDRNNHSTSKLIIQEVKPLVNAKECEIIWQGNRQEENHKHAVVRWQHHIKNKTSSVTSVCSV